VSGHRRIDERSVALHRAIAQKLRERPELLAIARDNLTRWQLLGGRSAPYLDEWQGILDRPLEDVLTLIEEPGERMTALRQSSPFAGILEPAERWAIYAQFGANGTQSAIERHDA